MRTSSGQALSRRLAKGELTAWRGLSATDANVGSLAGRLASRGVTVKSQLLVKPRTLWQLGGEHLIPGFIADLIVGGLWQGVSDAYNYPELWRTNPELAWRRVGASAATNATNGVIGTTIAVGVVGIASIFGASIINYGINKVGLTQLKKGSRKNVNKQAKNWLKE